MKKVTTLFSALAFCAALGVSNLATAQTADATNPETTTTRVEHEEDNSGKWGLAGLLGLLGLLGRRKPEVVHHNTSTVNPNVNR